MKSQFYKISWLNIEHMQNAYDYIIFLQHRKICVYSVLVKCRYT